LKEKNIKVLIQFLEGEDDWFKSKDILSYLGVSPRTLRNYIQEINQNYHDSLTIQSSNEGYKLKKYKRSEALITNEESTMDYRIYFILQKLVLAPNSVNVFDLSDELFVSVPSIEKDLSACRKFLKKFDLNVERTKDELVLHGEEQQKRKMMRVIYAREYNITFYNIVDLEKIFGYELHPFKKQLLDIIHKHHYEINEYTMGTIIYHIIISIERMQDNQYVHYHTYPLKDEFVPMDIILEIKQLIESYFAIRLDENELYYLQALISSKTTNINSEVVIQRKEKYHKLIDNIIDKVNESYLINLDDEEFKEKFSLHLQSLVIRAANHFSYDNPLTDSIKHSSPLIYDLSVYITNLISQELNIEIPEDEITYIALHVGSCIELKQKNEDRLSVVLVCPAYNNLQWKIKEKLEFYFPQQIKITKVISRIDKNIDTVESDMIISTLSAPLDLEIPEVMINTFIDANDVLKIQTQINQLNRNKKRNKIKNDLISLFNEDLFIQTDEVFKDEFEVIQFITEKMIARQLVKPNFTEDVITREKLSSTAFNNIIAVPHSINMDALQTTIAVIILKHPVQWGESSNIRVVSLIAMNYKERNIYRDIYDEYIKILTNSDNVNKLAESPSYKVFIDQIIDFIEVEDE
jgi:lichenan operon transcriptional antiterminator